jgi:malate/lactate dehydrogenase
MLKLSPKVCIVGCGNVGMRYAYSMMIGGVAREIVLVDYNKKKQKARPWISRMALLLWRP